MKKKCNRCGEEKPLSEYYKNKTTVNGYQGQCKTCMLEKAAAARLKKGHKPRYSDRTERQIKLGLRNCTVCGAEFEEDKSREWASHCEPCRKIKRAAKYKKQWAERKMAIESRSKLDTVYQIVEGLPGDEEITAHQLQEMRPELFENVNYASYCLSELHRQGHIGRRVLKNDIGLKRYAYKAQLKSDDRIENDMINSWRPANASA